MKTISFPLKSKQYLLILIFIMPFRLGWTATDCAQVSEIPLVECQALLDLYNMTDGPNWANKSGWNETDTPCSWYGVKCENGQVSQLNLPDNQLHGRVPASLQKLNKLTQLGLTDNQICDDIPDTLSSLADLKDTISDCPTPQNYTLTIETTGEGTVTEEDNINCGTKCSAEYLVDSTITLSAQADPGMTFMSWGGDCEIPYYQFDQLLTIKITKNMTCTARFDAIDFLDHTITVTKTGTGNGTLSFKLGDKPPIICEPTCKEETVTHQSRITLQAVSDSSSRLIGFFGQGCASSFNLTQNQSCRVRFDKLPSYTLTVTKSGQGSGHVTSDIKELNCNNDCSRSYLSGTTVTLTATPDVGSSFLGWTGDCNSSTNKAKFNIYSNLTCDAEFGIAGIPQLTPDREVVNFYQTRTVVKRTLTIQNSGNGGLRIEQLELVAPANFQITEDTCVNNVIIPNGTCTVTLQFRPPTATVADYNTQLLITSNDPQSPTVVALQGQGCSDDDAYQRYVSIEPYRLDFGVMTIGQTITHQQRIDMWSQGCGFLDLDTITLTGRHADEFTITDKNCYYGTWQGQNQASCWFTTEFHPTSVGLKEARPVVTYTDPTVEMSPYRWNAEAVSDGEPQLELSETEHDFGTITLGDATPSWSLTLTNIGTANLEFEQISIDQAEFKLYDAECALLAPQRSCQLWVQLTPTSAGDKLAQLTLVYAGTTVQIPLTATVTELVDCSPEHITITTTGQSALWEDPLAWQRLQGSTAIPGTSDVVRIDSTHMMVGLPLIQVKALCIEANALLLSPDDQGTALEIQATDYFSNQGRIWGLDGVSSSETCNNNCAKPGASVIIKIGSQFSQQAKKGDWWWYGDGGPIFNSGEIKAGNGGSSNNVGAPGGDALIIGRNTTNLGLIQAGQGGDVLGTGAGQAGKGGLTQIWGKLGGEGHLYNQNGAQAIAGDSGHCNPAATTPQTGQNGGNLWLVSLPDVHLNDGIYRAGHGSEHCTPDGTDGFVQIEPSIIDLIGANTHISGGGITIFGGNDWILDLRNTAGELLEATGDITLATGRGGIIDLRDNHTVLFKANGQVNLFADTILLDEGVTLADLIDAQAIVVGPDKILFDVSLMGSGSSILGQPQTTVPVTFSLFNNGPQADTYLIKVTDTAGWPLSFTEQQIRVEGLTHLVVTPQVTLPSEPGMANLITMTATSQTDPNVKATAQTQMTVASQPQLPPPPATLPTVLSDNQLINIITPLDNIMALNEMYNAQNEIYSAHNDDITLPTTQPKAPTLTLAPTVMDSTLVNSFLCPLNTDFINWPCDNHQQTLQDVNFGPQASVAGGTLAGIIHNEGWLSQLTVAPAAQVIGGKFTGDIDNQGTLIDIQFVGRQVYGGTLQGVIANQSQIGGTFTDVILADNTVLSGGAVAGQITGHCPASSRLESLTVLPRSNLECVILGKGVTLSGEVNLQDVQIAVSPTALQIADSADLITLPNLTATATDEQAQTQPTLAVLAGGVAINAAPFQSHAQATATDWVKVYGQIQAEPIHRNQPAEIVVYGRYKAQSSESQPVNFMLVNTENAGKPQIQPWDGQLSNLAAFETLAALPGDIIIPIYDNLLTLGAGQVEIFLGYQIIQANGKALIIHNQTGIEIVVQ